MDIASLTAELGLSIQKGQFEAGTKVIEGLHHALEALAIFEGLDTLKEWALHVSETADKAAKLSLKLGVSTDAIQELGYAASLSDSSLEGVTGALTRIERGLDSSGKKSGGFASAMQKLGISMSDPIVKAKDADAIFMTIADKFEKLPAGVDRASIAVGIFGKSGTNLIPMLSSGRKGIQDLRDEAHTLGLVIEAETTHAFEEWNDSMTKVKGAVQGLKNDAVVALLPVLKEATDSLFAWIKANRELIKIRLEQVMNLVVTAAKALGRAIAILYGWFEKIAPIVETAVTAFGELLGAGGNLEDGLVAAAIAVAGAWVLAELPILTLIALIGALALILNSVWRAIEGKDSAIGELGAAFERALGETGAGRVVLGLRSAFVSLFNFLEAKLKWLMARADDAVQFVEGVLGVDKQSRLDMANAGGDPNVASQIRRSREMKAGGVPAEMAKFLGVDYDSLKLQGIDSTVTASDEPGIDKVVRAHAQASLPPTPLPNTPWAGYAMPASFATAGQLEAPLAPQMHLEITVQGNADAGAISSIEAQVRNFWDTAIRDAKVDAGAAGGGQQP